MGKALTSIVQVAAVAGLTYLTGGTFAGIAASVGVSAGAAGAVGLAIASTVSGLTVSTAFGFLGLGPSAPKPDTTVTAIKTSRPERVSAYGLCRPHYYAEEWA